MIKPFLKWHQPLNDKTKTIFKQTLHEWTLCHTPWRLQCICVCSRWTSILDQAMWLPIQPSWVREERQNQWWCHTEHLFSCSIMFKEAAVVHLASDRAALCWGWRGGTGLSAFFCVFYYVLRTDWCGSSWVILTEYWRFIRQFEQTSAVRLAWT